MKAPKGPKIHINLNQNGFRDYYPFCKFWSFAFTRLLSSNEYYKWLVTICENKMIIITVIQKKCIERYEGHLCHVWLRIQKSSQNRQTNIWEYYFQESEQEYAGPREGKNKNIAFHFPIKINISQKNYFILPKRLCNLQEFRFHKSILPKPLKIENANLMKNIRDRRNIFNFFFPFNFS